MHRIVFVNDSAGRRDDVPACLASFERHDIKAAHEVLVPMLDNSRSGRVLVAVWGGDGSIRTVAGILVGSSAMLLACPGGTHNHFCRTLGIRDEDDMAAAIEAVDERMIDVGKAGSELFLNNLSIGWYTDLVSRRERYERVVPRKLAKLTSLVVQLVRTRRLRVTVDEMPERVWLVWVGNGEYSISSTSLTERASIDSGVLDVRLLRAGTRLPKLRALVAVCNGNTESSPHIVRRVAPSTNLRLAHSHVRAALDGELVVLASPVEITVVRSSLRVLVGPTFSSS